MRPERSWSQSDSWSQAANMLWGPGFNGVIHSQRTAYRTIGIVAVQCSLTIGTLLTTDDAQLLLRTVRNLFLLFFVRIFHNISISCKLHLLWQRRQLVFWWSWRDTDPQGDHMCITPWTVLGLVSQQGGSHASQQMTDDDSQQRKQRSLSSHFASAHVVSGVCFSTASLSGDWCATQIRGPEIFICVWCILQLSRTNPYTFFGESAGTWSQSTSGSWDVWFQSATMPKCAEIQRKQSNIIQYDNREQLLRTSWKRTSVAVSKTLCWLFIPSSKWLKPTIAKGKCHIKG